MKLHRRSTAIRESTGDRIYLTIVYCILTVILVVILYPLIYVLSASFSSPNAVQAGKVWLWPVNPGTLGYQLVFEKGMAVDYPLTICHRDGTLTEVLYNASVYRDGGGKVLGVFAAARDVTKLNRAETELVQQRLNELDRMAELEHFQRLTVGRELKMIELKKENEYLRRFGPADGDEQSGAY